MTLIASTRQYIRVGMVDVERRGELFGVAGEIKQAHHVLVKRIDASLVAWAQLLQERCEKCLI